MSEKTAEEIRRTDENIAKNLESIADYKAKLEVADDEFYITHYRSMIDTMQETVKIEQKTKKILLFTKYLQFHDEQRTSVTCLLSLLWKRP